ncbi:MAG: AAA family ATPase [Gemmatimonadota bacterium]|nr:AAA family ATPase [Gemmatimonadota bacterium]
MKEGNGCPYVERAGADGEGAVGPTRLAIAGKGGTGKTTIAGTVARLTARKGRSVLAIDGDTNPNLAHILGLPPGAAEELRDLPRDILERVENESGSRIVLTVEPEALIRDYGAEAPDGVELLVMGKVDHAGAG